MFVGVGFALVGQAAAFVGDASAQFGAPFSVRPDLGPLPKVLGALLVEAGAHRRGSLTHLRGRGPGLL